MKVIRYSEYGDPAKVATLIEEETGPPQSGQIVVDIEAAPIHIVDLKNMAGEPRFRPQLPAVPGHECIGRISEVGRGVSDFRAGDRVFLPFAMGAWRQQIRVKTVQAVPAPEGDAAQLSLIQLNAVTSELILRDFGDLIKGDWLIQNAANSNCGIYLIELARMRGIKTVNVVRRESLVPQLKEIGADVVLVDGPGLARRVAAETHGAAIRLGIDAVCGDATTRIGECLTDRGTILAYGLLSGEPCHIPARMLYRREIRLRGYYMSRQMFRRSRAEQREIYDFLAKAFTAGTLRARIAATYSLDQVAEAVTHAGKVGEDRNGKIVLLP